MKPTSKKPPLSPHGTAPLNAIEENLTGPLALQRSKTMPKSILLAASQSLDSTPSTDPTVRPTRSVSFRDNDEVLEFKSHDVPMACGPDWDPNKLDDDSDDDDLNLLFSKTLEIAQPPKRAASEPPGSFKIPPPSSPLAQKAPGPPRLEWTAKFNFERNRKGDGEYVWLRTMNYDSHRNLLFGTINVRNLSMNKTVFLRVTKDGWKTQEDVPATFAEHIPRLDPSTDTFIAEIPLSKNITSDLTVQFCMCCRMNGQEYWDSNGGNNYQVTFEKSSG